jgi:hypothetical protein
MAVGWILSGRFNLKNSTKLEKSVLSKKRRFSIKFKATLEKQIREKDLLKDTINRITREI